MSPDWSATPTGVPSAHMETPQSFNLYAYVGNDPVDGEDADGHSSFWFGDGTLDNGDGILEHYVKEFRDSIRPASSSEETSQSQATGSVTVLAQQKSTSSSGGGFWHHVGNLLHGHSWNYVQTTVTVTQIDTIREPNGVVTGATDAAGLIGMAAPTVAKDLHLGPLSAGASIANDPSMKNIGINLFGLTELGGAPMATTGALVDFMDWSVKNSSPGPKKAYGNDQLQPVTIPTQNDGARSCWCGLSMMFEFSQLVRPPYIFLILGVLSISAAAVFSCTGRVWVRFNGWVYRAKEPRSFWGEVAAYLLVGLCFIGYFLFEI